MKHLTHKKCFQYFLHFQTIAQLATRLCCVFNKLSTDLACIQSPRRSGTFQNFAYFEIIADIQFYASQLVKVRYVFVFLGRTLLVQDSESQEDQYLFEICPVEHSVQICHQIYISCVSSYPGQFTACLS